MHTHAHTRTQWPEKIYYADSPVTTIDFSTLNPVLLAAGFQDGHIAIYDLRDEDGVAALENTGVKGKHHDPVWELKWVDQETSAGEEGALKGGEEHLVSVSTDGRVSKWVLHKGLEHLGRQSREGLCCIAAGAALLWCGLVFGSSRDLPPPPLRRLTLHSPTHTHTHTHTYANAHPRTHAQTSSPSRESSRARRASRGPRRGASPAPPSSPGSRGGCALTFVTRTPTFTW
jgi:WD40 repeat protein